MAEKYYPSFASGEISPSLYGRVDIDKYGTALQVCENMIVRPFGGVAGRPGTEYICRTKYSTQAVILQRFVYSREQAYLIEFGPNYALFIANGARVTDGVSVAVTNVTSYSGGFEITTSSAHGLVVGDVAVVAGVSGTGSTPCVNDSHTVTSVVSTTVFRVPRLSTTTATYTSGGTVEKCIQLVTPYGANDLTALRFTQSADVLTIFHSDYQQREIRRTSPTAFAISIPEYEDGPFLDMNTDESILVHASAAEGSVTLTASSGIFKATHVGALFKLEEKNLQETKPWEPGRRFGAHDVYGIKRRSDGKTYECISIGSSSVKTGTVQPTHEEGIADDGSGDVEAGVVSRNGVTWKYLHSGYGILRITAYASATSVSATVLKRLPDAVVGGAVAAAGPWTMTGDGADTTLTIAGTTTDETKYEVIVDGVMLGINDYTITSTTVLTFAVAPALGVAVTARQLELNNRTDFWSFGAWSEEEGYPSVGTYYNDRLWQGATRKQPQRLDASKVGDYYDYGVSTPLQDDDALSLTMNARDVNAIVDLVPLDKLIALTSVSANKVGSGTDTAITPSNIGFEPQVYYGAYDLPVRIMGDAGIYVQRGGNKVRELAYDDRYGKFTGPELSILSRHMLAGGATVVDTDLADEPDSIIWLVMSTGVLIGMTYIKEQEVVGWHRHPLPGALVKRVCVIPAGNNDEAYIVVTRTVMGATRQYIERITPSVVDSDIELTCVDSSLSYDGRGDGTQSLLLTGSNWAADGVLTVTLSSGSIELAPGDVGNVLVSGDWRGEILTVTSGVAGTVRSIVVTPEAIRGVVTTDWALAKDVFVGLDHLVGVEVAVSADGIDAGTYTVSTSGSVTLDDHGGLVRIGVPYTPTMETLRLDAEFLSTKKLVELGIFVESTASFWAGDPEGEMNEYRTREDDDSYGSPAPVTDIAEVSLTSGFGKGGRIRVEQRAPLPIRVMAIVGDFVKGSS